MANVETVELPRLTINAPALCSLPVLPSDYEDLLVGQVFEI